MGNHSRLHLPPTSRLSVRRSMRPCASRTFRRRSSSVTTSPRSRPSRPLFFFWFYMGFIYFFCAFSASKEVILTPLTISRTEGERVLIESSINSLRISIKIKQVRYFRCMTLFIYYLLDSSLSRSHSRPTRLKRSSARSSPASSCSVLRTLSSFAARPSR